MKFDVMIHGDARIYISCHQKFGETQVKVVGGKIL